MSKYMYTEEFKFMLGGGKDNDNRVELPYQEIDQVMKSISLLPLYLRCKPLTKQPYLNCDDESREINSSKIVKMEKKDGVCEVTTGSGIIYRLITE